ncbi:hypothetical protein QBC44DRAFT_318883 [Cladorrhinum sp. PSN332]|nr:hypothetical protein QBC44DRAFT_318883 [Cladorrhinum sp. PSN332]
MLELYETRLGDKAKEMMGDSPPRKTKRSEALDVLKGWRNKVKSTFRRKHKEPSTPADEVNTEANVENTREDTACPQSGGTLVEASPHSSPSLPSLHRSPEASSKSRVHPKLRPHSRNTNPAPALGSPFEERPTAEQESLNNINRKDKPISEEKAEQHVRAQESTRKLQEALEANREVAFTAWAKDSLAGISQYHTTRRLLNRPKLSFTSSPTALQTPVNYQLRAEGKADDDQRCYFRTPEPLRSHGNSSLRISTVPDQELYDVDSDDEPDTYYHPHDQHTYYQLFNVPELKGQLKDIPRSYIRFLPDLGAEERQPTPQTRFNNNNETENNSRLSSWYEAPQHAQLDTHHYHHHHHRRLKTEPFLRNSLDERSYHCPPPRLRVVLPIIPEGSLLLTATASFSSC